MLGFSASIPLSARIRPNEKLDPSIIGRKNWTTHNVWSCGNQAFVTNCVYRDFLNGMLLWCKHYKLCMTST